MFAAHAAVLLNQVRSRADVRQVSTRLAASLRARDVVNIAKGVLMCREDVDEQAAFLLLSKAAEEEGRPLRAVAERAEHRGDHRAPVTPNRRMRLSFKGPLLFSVPADCPPTGSLHVACVWRSPRRIGTPIGMEQDHSRKPNA